MNISYTWLKDYINIDLPADEVDNKLTLLGLEVDAVEHIGSSLNGVVVGEVLECTQHPNADRLKVCQVNNGEETVQIICGASNVAAGQKVFVAKVGAELPIKLENGKNLVIKKAKLRGEESKGMICAEDELGLGDDHEGIMVLDNSLEPGTPIHEVVELFEDTVFEIAITPNRPDATSHIGVARDLAAVTETPLNKPEIIVDTSPIEGEELDIQILDTQKCHRFVGKLIKNVTIKESPSWLKNRLTAIGLRPINNVVDITNFVMFELGQPLHAYDYDQVGGKKIIVQSFDKETKFTTLDDVERKVPAGSLFICDGEKAVGIAGVMGGQNSEVSPETTNILLEAAYFDPSTTRKTAKTLALQTDASYRFERGIDPNLAPVAAQRAAELIAELGEGELIKGSMDVHPVVTQAITLELRTSFLNRMLGTTLATKEAADILSRLEFEILSSDENGLTCSVPTFRPDVEREIDLVEEVGRVMDFNTIPSPTHVDFIIPDPIPFHEKLLQRASKAAVMSGFKEIYTNSLLPQEKAVLYAAEDDLVSTLNPVSQEMTTLRPSMIHGFLQSAAYNFNRSAQTIRFFEIGHTFKKTEVGNWVEGVTEEIKLFLGLGGTTGAEHWNQKPAPITSFELASATDSILTALGLTFEKSLDDQGALVYKTKGEEIAVLSSISNDLKKVYDLEHPVYVAEINLSTAEVLLEKTGEKGYTPVPKFPVFEFDLAVVVAADTPAASLMNTIKSKAGKLLTDINIFDVFEGESIGAGNKSIAFRLNFLDPNKTLNIKDVEPIIQKVLKVLDKEFSAKLRS